MKEKSEHFPLIYNLKPLWNLAIYIEGFFIDKSYNKNNEKYKCLLYIIYRLFRTYYIYYEIDKNAFNVE